MSPALNNFEEKPILNEAEGTQLEKQILDIIQKGHKNAIGLNALCKRVGTDERRVRLAIEALRNSGNIILFGQRKKIINNGKSVTLPSGYFIGENLVESLEFMEYMRSRIIAEARIIRSIKKATVLTYGLPYQQLNMFGQPNKGSG